MSYLLSRPYRGEFDAPPRKDAKAPAAQASVNDEEPFGQIGVRQYILPALSMLSLTAMLLSAVFWYRSTQIVDDLSRVRQGEVWQLRSVAGRVLVTRHQLASPTRKQLDDSGWRYRARPAPRAVPDAWEDSAFKRVGVEFRAEPLRPDASAGAWLRIRWSFLIAVLAILPIIRVIHYRRQRRQMR